MDDSGRMLIFCAPRFLEHLARSTVWYGDGTFSVTPPFFAQLYTIHADVNGLIVPTAYALLPNKTQDTYRRMFASIQSAIQAKGLQVHQEFWRCDFEKAVMNAVGAEFSDVAVEGCFFHFAQANWKQLNAMGCRKRYSEDSSFATDCRMHTAIAFLPPEAIQDAYKQVQAATDVPDEFRQYFERTYIGFEETARNRTRFRQPLFAPEVWSVYSRTHGDSPKTTNHLEGWHRRFGSIIGKCHPNIWEFLTRLKEEQVHSEFRLAQMASGVPPPPRKKADQQKKRLLTLTENYSSNSIDAVTFIRGCSHNFKY